MTCGIGGTFSNGQGRIQSDIDQTGAGGGMRNTKTKRVLDYWISLKTGRPVPLRADIHPRDLKGVLPYIFLADCIDPETTIFRLAGTGLCERYGRELRDHNLQAMWPLTDRPTVRHLIERVRSEPAPGILLFRAETIDRRSVSGEILLLPLADQNGTVNKLLGCAFATESTAWLGHRPLVHQKLLETRLLVGGARPEVIAAPAAPVHEPAAPQPATAKRSHLRLVVSQDLPEPPPDVTEPTRSSGL